MRALMHDLGVAHQLRAPPSALVLPDQERRPARLRTRGDRSDCAGGAVPPARDAEEDTRGVRASVAILRRTVRTLASILRVAESLDRSHAQVISRLEVQDRGDEALLLQLRTSGDAELEIWAASRHMAPFEKLVDRPVHLVAAPLTRN